MAAIRTKVVVTFSQVEICPKTSQAGLELYTVKLEVIMSFPINAYTNLMTFFILTQQSPDSGDDCLNTWTQE